MEDVKEIKATIQTNVRKYSLQKARRESSHEGGTYKLIEDIILLVYESTVINKRSFHTAELPF